MGNESCKILPVAANVSSLILFPCVYVAANVNSLVSVPRVEFDAVDF